MPFVSAHFHPLLFMQKRNQGFGVGLVILGVSDGRVGDSRGHGVSATSFKDAINSVCFGRR